MVQTRPKRRVVPQLEFVAIDQPGMVVLKGAMTTGPDEIPVEVEGAYVKVSPTLRASERTQYDAKAVRDALLARGACAVVVAPVVVPDGKQARAQAQESGNRLSSEAHIRSWFEGVKASKAVIDRAIEEALLSAGEAGL